MSAVDCWECGRTYPNDMVFDIPVFNDLNNSRATIRWCFSCANKQLKYTEFIIIKKGIVGLLKEYNNKLFNELKLVIKDYHEHLDENISFLRKIKELK